MNKIWYQVYERKFSYSGEEPFFYDYKQFDWSKKLKEAFPIMLEELQPLMNDKEEALTTYFRDASQNKIGTWKTTGLKFWSRNHNVNLKKYPKTASILNSIPNLVGATFNLLESGGHILPHNGETNANIRCQIPFKVPSGLPDCGFKVGDQSNPWEVGKPLLFTDAHQHTAWNRSSETRYIMIVDVIREEFTNKTYSVCCHVMAMQSLAIVCNILKIKIDKIPYVIRLILYFPILVFWFLYMPIHRKFGSYIYGS